VTGRPRPITLRAMGWNVGLAVLEGADAADLRVHFLRDRAGAEPDAVRSLNDATTSEWRDEFVGFGRLGERLLVAGSFVWEHDVLWKKASRQGRVFAFFLSENWGGANVYDLYEGGVHVRSYREDDGHGRPLFVGKKHRLEPVFKARTHPADRIGHIFEAMTGQGLLTQATLETEVALHRRP
jgi:hypothetical protein